MGRGRSGNGISTLDGANTVMYTLMYVATLDMLVDIYVRWSIAFDLYDPRIKAQLQ